MAGSHPAVPTKMASEKVRGIRGVPVNRDFDGQSLIDMVVEAAPSWLRHRSFPQSIDWGRVATAKVARMLTYIAEAGMTPPPWLARQLAIGGHVLDLPGLDAETRALITVNRAQTDPDPARSAAAESAAADLALNAEADADAIIAAVKALGALGNGAAAAKLALAHWPRVPRALRFAQKDITALAAKMPPVHLRVTGFSTTQVLAAELIPAFAASGWRVEVSEANFGEVMPELLQPTVDADATLLLLDAHSFHERDWRQPAGNSLALIEDKLGALASAIGAFLAARPRPLIITTLPSPAATAAGLVDNRHPAGARHMAEVVNRRLVDLAAGHSEIILIDTDLALAAIAPAARSEAKLWFYGRIAYAPDANRALAHAVARSWQLLKRGPAKVLALDFDNTLWGGIFGEDGVANLQCGDDAPGNAFKAFQQECLRLKGMGFLLVALSKNNPDAITAFRDHPGMALREDDFVATAINWEPKPDNIRRIAEELNLGLDSFIFFDDSPHEREAMRRLCPMVLTPELPDDPARRPGWLRTLSATWPVRLTEEDERRSDMYAVERKAKVLRQQSANLEDYLGGLEQKLTIVPGSAATLGRIAQMHARTNQFNLTTARLSEAEIGVMLADAANHAVICGRLTDKFGDHGIVIAATARLNGNSAEIVSFLMSCRVIGRQVERAFLGELMQTMRTRGATRIEAAFIPTAKNAMVKDFYPTHGFAALGVDGERHLWHWTAGDMDRPRSDFVDVHWES